MGPSRYSLIAHAEHVFCAPVDGAQVDRLVGLLELPTGARVLDLGCGKGELLLRILRKCDSWGVGVDLAGPYLEEARRRAAGLGIADRVEWRQEDMDLLKEPESSYDLVVNVGAIPDGGFVPMLWRMNALAKPGALLLVGQGFWKREPDPEYLERLGATRAAFGTHAGNLVLARAEGLEPVQMIVSSDADWDYYEGLYHDAVLRYVEANPSDPEADEMVARADAGLETYRRFGRDTLGFALYLLRKSKGWR